jgi:hypothetical protein
MLGLEASGTNPLDVGSGGNTPVDYLRDHIDRLRSVNDLERTVLALEGAGVDSRSFAGHDLIAELRSRREGDGSVSGQTNLTSFFILGMRAGGGDSGDLGRSVEWLRDAQNRDGGWGINPGAQSDPDSTGAVLQALAAANARGGTASDGVRWLRRAQRGSGGWGLNTTGVVNVQSTAWAVQGLVAVGSGGEPLGEGLAYLAGRQASDGHYTYSTATDQTPVWVTSQALVALARKPLPLAPVARKPGPSPQSAPAGGGAGSNDGPAPDPSRPGGTGGRPHGPSPEGDREAHRPDRGDRDDRASGGGGDAGGRERGDVAAETAVSTVPAAAATDPASEPGEDDDDNSAAAYTAADLAVLAVLVGGLVWWRRRTRGASPTTR